MSRRGLELALEKAVKCDVDAKSAFMGASGFSEERTDDPKPQLEALGVKIVDLSTPTQTDRITYWFPPGIKVFGHEVNRAVSYNESTEMFYLTLRSGSRRLKEINKTLRLRPVPKGNPDRYGLFDEIKVSHIRKLGDDKDSPPDTIFSGLVNHRDDIVIGCQNLAW